MSKLTMKQVFAVLGEQANSKESFGRIARDMRLINKRTLADLLFVQSEQTPSLAATLVDMGAITEQMVKAELMKVRSRRVQSRAKRDSHEPSQTSAPQTGATMFQCAK